MKHFIFIIIFLSAIFNPIKNGFSKSAAEQGNFKYEAAESGPFIDMQFDVGRYVADGNSSGVSNGGLLSAGFITAEDLWERREYSVGIFFKSLQNNRDRVSIPGGGQFKFAYGYRLGKDYYAHWLLGLGMGSAKLRRKKGQAFYENVDPLWAQLGMLGFQLDSVIGNNLSFRAGFKWSHLICSIDELRSGDQIEKLNRTEHFNTYEISMGLRFKFANTRRRAQRFSN